VLSREEISKLSHAELMEAHALSLELNQKHEALIEAQAEDIAHLKEQFNQLRRLIFGVKSERFIPSESSPSQLSLFVDPIDEQSHPAEKPEEMLVKRNKKNRPKSSNHNGRQLLKNADHLERQQIIIEPDIDTTNMACIGEEVTEMLCITEAKLYVKQYVRRKYVEKQITQVSTNELSDTNEKGTKIHIGSLPDFPYPQVMADVSLIAHLLISKFVDHLPENRILKIFKRQQLKIPSSTINGWTHRGIKTLIPLFEALKKEVLSSHYLQADETTIKILEKDKKKGKTHLGYFWAYHAVSEQALFFDYQPGRDQSGPTKLLEHYRGYLQCDGYAVYDVIDKNNQHIKLMHCMAHARRKFEKALTNDHDRAAHAMTEIQKLYRIERLAKEYNISEERHKKLRNRMARPILEQLGAWLATESKKIRPTSSIGEAIIYAHKRWDKLMLYLDDVSLCIDNNLIENKIRPIAIGRKNYLFAGSHQAAQNIAMLYSLLGTCKLNNINPHQWLTDVLNRIHNHDINKIHQLLPYRWTPTNQ
jgi:transposase